MKNGRNNVAAHRTATCLSRDVRRQHRVLRTAPSSLIATGYTLFEMLIAMSIIVLITSLGWSPVMRLQREYRVKEAAEAVREMVAGTRILALDQDIVFQFRFEPSGRRYMRVPYENSNGAAQGGKTVTASGQSHGELPAGVYFESINDSPAEALNPELLAGLPSEFSQTSWSAPILFYSDGTSSNAEFDVVDESASTRRIRVRDITGAATVSTTN